MIVLNNDVLRKMLHNYQVLAAQNEFEIDEQEFLAHQAEIASQHTKETMEHQLARAVYRCLTSKSVANRKEITASGGASPTIIAELAQINKLHASALSSFKSLHSDLTEAVQHGDERISETVKAIADSQQHEFLSIHNSLVYLEARVSDIEGQLVEIRRGKQDIIYFLQEHAIKKSDVARMAKKAIIGFGILVALIVLSAVSAHAQSVNPAIVVAACGAPTLTVGNRTYQTVDVNGNLCTSGSVSIAGVATSANQTNGSQKTQIVDSLGNSVTVTGNKLDVNASFSPSGTQDTNLKQINGNTVSAGNGISGTGVQRVTIASDSTGVVGLATGANTIGAISNTSFTATQATASSLNAQVVGAVASGGANAGNPVKTSGVFNTTQPTVANGQIVDSQMTARGAQIVATGTDTFNVTVNAALPTGANTIGAVTQASGPWTSNITQVNSAAVNVGTGAAGTGTLRVTTSTDSTIGTLTTITNAVTVSQGTATNLKAQAEMYMGGVAVSSAAPAYVRLTDGTTATSVIAATNALKTDMSSVAGTATATGNGTVSAGVQRVAIASDNTAFSVNATLAAETTKVIGTVRNLGNAGAIFDGATGAAPPANVLYMGGVVSGATGGLLGGVPICDTVAVFNISTATTTLVITGVSGRHVRICGVSLMTAAANNLAFLSGTGATCGTGTAGMSGGTSAASGYNFAANSGMAYGGGIGTVMKTVATGDSVCIITSAATQLSGQISYAIY